MRAHGFIETGGKVEQLKIGLYEESPVKKGQLQVDNIDDGRSVGRSWVVAGWLAGAEVEGVGAVVCF